MSKYFKRGNYKLATAQNVKSLDINTITLNKQFFRTPVAATEKTIINNLVVGQSTPFIKTLIIRGIGYRVFLIENDFTTNSNITFNSNTNFNEVIVENNENDYEFWSETVENEQKHLRYLLIRAGHTQDKFIPLPSTLHIKTVKKDRKLIIFGSNKQHVAELAYQVFKYRKPSVYTGRGVRRKKN